MKYLIGIDPSLENMGVAVYEIATKELTLKTGRWIEMLEWISAQPILAAQGGFVLENPELDSRFFGTTALLNNGHKYKQGVIGQAEWSSQVQIAMTCAQSVGKNKAAAKVIIDMLSGCKLIQIAPSSRDKMVERNADKVRFLNMPTKTTAKQFCELTGYEKRCSEHARDAATLVWGRNAAWFELRSKSNLAQ
jgi:hypothetical protein